MGDTEDAKSHNVRLIDNNAKYILVSKYLLFLHNLFVKKGIVIRKI